MNCVYFYIMYFEYDNDKIFKIKDIFLNFKFFFIGKRLFELGFVF